MHINFADWYVPASIDPQTIPLNLRWKGVEAVTDNLDTSGILNLARVLFGLPKATSEFKQTISERFKEFDPAFLMRDNDLELQVLVGACLINCIENSDIKTADLAALAILLGDFQGKGKRPVLPDAINIAKEHLHRRSDSLRSNSIIPSIELPRMKVSLAEDLEPDALVPALRPELEKLSRMPEKVAKPINEAMQKLFQEMQLLQEESNIVWYLFSEFSRDLKVGLATIELPSAALIVGKELGDLVTVMPGPVSAPAYIGKALTSAKATGTNSFTIVDVLAGESLKRWTVDSGDLEGTAIPSDLCSLHDALIERHDPVQGSPTVLLGNGVETSNELTAAEVGLQMYRERLLLKMISAQNS